MKVPAGLEARGWHRQRFLLPVLEEQEDKQ